MQLEAVKGYVQNGLFYPTIGKVIKTPEPVEAVLTYLGKPVEVFNQDIISNTKNKDELEAIRQARLSVKGSMKGKIWMSDDFDEPLEEMKEYME